MMATNGWNRTNVESKPAAPKKSKGFLVWLIVGALLVVAVLAAWLFLSSNESERAVEKTDRPSHIKEVTPAAAPKVAEEEKKEEIPYWKVDASQTNGFTRAMQHKWRDMHADPPGYVGKNRHKKSAWHIFEHRSENLIASILRSDPGKGFIGTPNYRGINEDFLKSCQEPIIVKEDDTEYVKQLKRDMNAVKIELKQRIEAGEDLGQMIEEAREEGRRLAEYKQTLTKELRELVKKEARTESDVDDFEAAANKMLESKGVSPIKLGPITRQCLLKNNIGLKPEGENK